MDKGCAGDVQLGTVMELDRVRQTIARIQASSEPLIEFLRRAEGPSSRVGVFASSFNPITCAHVALIERAAREIKLHETLALAGVSNADKASYECSLEDRLAMLLSALKHDPRMSVGISSHAYFVDVIAALEPIYPSGAQFFFIVGFDTFERVLDRNNLYTRRYHRGFPDRVSALKFLLEHACLVVAGRAGSTQRDLASLLKDEPREIAANVLYLDLPSDIAARSATEVRERVRRGQPIEGLVPPSVESYIAERNIYTNRALL